jgi:hypothetical protein
MLRLTILASTLPLMLAAFFARGDLVRGAGPCIATADSTVQLASLPWQAQSHVSFTTDPAAATVRVRIVDDADDADFAVVDDVDSAEPGACPVTAATHLIGISAAPSDAEPVIYLTDRLTDHGSAADYRIFVKSRSFTAHDAAALIVSAHRVRPRIAAL